MSPLESATSTEPTKLDIGSSYDGTTATYRLLRTFNWGPLLMNLGYYPFRGPLRPLNWFTDLSLSQRRLVGKSIARLDLRPGHDVLDVACGRGMSTFMIHQRAGSGRVVGVDFLPENIRAAHTLFAGYSNLSYRQGDAGNLDFADASFDRIHCLEAAFHFPDKPQFLRECRRVLRPGGRLVLVDIFWRTTASRREADPRRTDIIKQIWQFHDLFSGDEYKAAAEDAGFLLAAERDWTNQVTEPLLSLFGHAVWLAKRPWGRKLIEAYNPQAKSLSDSDWRDLEISADAHREQRKHGKYMAYEFIVPR